MAIPAEFINEGSGAVDLDRDRLLVVRYQQGDQEAFDELYRRYFPRLSLYCQRRVGDRHVAEELAQESFVRALKAMPRFAGDRRFYPWMTVIAQRLCIDHHRRSARVEPAAEIDTGVVEADHGDVFHEVDRNHLAVAMQRVAPRHREVLDLREGQGWSYTRIAAHLDVPVTTVEALLHRARRALRREFLSVSSGSRLAGMPIIGWAMGRVARIRARLGVAWEAWPITNVVVPAVAGVAAMTLVVVPMVRDEPSREKQVVTTATTNAPAPSPIVTDASAPVTTFAADAPAVPTAAPPTSVSTTPGATAPPPGGTDLGVAQVYGPEGEAYITEQIEQKPVQIDLGPLLQLGVDPKTLLPEILQSLAEQLTGAPK